MHTGGKTSSDESQLPLLEKLPSWFPKEEQLPHMAIVGAFKVSSPAVKYDDMEEPKDEWAFGPICNMISQVITLETSVACKGKLNLWRVEDEQLKTLKGMLREGKFR